MSNASYAARISDFLVESPDEVLGALTAGDEELGFSSLLHSQTRAWKEQLAVLQRELSILSDVVGSAGLVLEYPIPRRGKRMDAALIFGDAVLVLEFKSDKQRGDAADRAQVEDYCLDLRDFHLPSRKMTLVPILIPTAYVGLPSKLREPAHQVTPVVIASPNSLHKVIRECVTNLVTAVKSNVFDWVMGAYRPTPTIIEAACQLYARMDVTEIARSHADATNLQSTTNAVLNAVGNAASGGRKIICFITGVPGAGKTLAGLNIVHNAALHSQGDLGVFLSGNGPLVNVLREALARDEHHRSGQPIVEARRKSATFIQNVHQFLKTYTKDPQTPPDRVVIFDEAQRAWNAEQSFRKFKRPKSEPELMLEIMSRHEGWAVIVCLIGGGQEINTGEAGLPEWGRVIRDKFPTWQVMISNELVSSSHGTGGQPLFDAYPDDLDITTDQALHLDVSIRAFRAEKLSRWVDSLLAERAVDAKTIGSLSLQEYPLYLTRDLDEARDWLRSQRRGTRRSGLLASSGARRLRAYGIDVTIQLGVEDWFLAGPDDIRSSSFLELAGREFTTQGLELDWSCVCWGADLRMTANGWSFNKFRGNRWTLVKNPVEQRYILNRYRVLLTRAREGCVIWVPRGSAHDGTRKAEYYDQTAEYLLQSGVRPLYEVIPGPE